VHEVAAIQAAVEDILSLARAQGDGRVRAVQLQVGVAEHTDEQVIRAHFEALTLDTPAAGARLEIVWVPAKLRCFDCGHAFEQPEPGLAPACPACAGRALEESHSDMLAVSELDIVEGSGTSCA
jgi:hydrogenase nickel incorporation protein HypA/HybF